MNKVTLDSGSRKLLKSLVDQVCCQRDSDRNLSEQEQALLSQILSTLASNTSGLATESTLTSLLNNLIASQDVEVLLVRDTGDSDVVVQQIREYDQGTGAWTTRYEAVDGTAHTVVGPLEYLDPSAVLNLVLTEIQSLSTNFSNNAGGNRTPNFIRPTGSGSIAVDTYDASFANVGLSDGTLLGSTIRPGEVISFSAGALNNIYPSGVFTYDATGTEFMVTYNT